MIVDLVGEKVESHFVEFFPKKDDNDKEEKKINILFIIINNICGLKIEI